MTAAIQIEHLTKTFRTPFSNKLTTALEDLSLTVPCGAIMAILGPNGSGKSTLLKILLGLLSPTKGTATLFGIPSHNVTARRHIGFLPERPSFEPFLTIQEALLFYGSFSGAGKKSLLQKSKELLEQFQLTQVASLSVRHASQGTLQRLGLAQALLPDPKLLILDEPTTGLDPAGIRFFSHLLSQLKAQGKTVLLTSHLLTQIEETCTHIAILKKGKLLYSENRIPSATPPKASPLEEIYLTQVFNSKEILTYD
ncbi:MAG: ABC transporter ATP-binding protein [Chthoniobacterales bacterium]|nr:ABC transporter ATP-binding protein [Chthoniobacterales bacterium]